MIKLRPAVLRHFDQGSLKRLDLNSLHVLRKHMIKLYNGKLICRHDINSLNHSRPNVWQIYRRELGNGLMEDIGTEMRQANRSDFLQN